MKRLLCIIIRGYQKYISPLKPPAIRCRFYPTCSQYGLTAIERFGAFRGSLLTIKRILRCNPLGGFGIDHVPEILKEKKNASKN